MPIRVSLLSLLALADAESLPALSYADICALLSHTQKDSVSREEISYALKTLEQEGVVISCDDWHALREAPDIDEAKKRIRTSQKKIVRNRIFFFIMQAIPFIEAAAITGSVSMGNAKEKSDIDILCIVQKGRIWTARILLLFLTELFGTRREQKNLLDKMCFNCFVTKNTLFPMRTIASAHMLARANPLFGNETHEVFFAHNAWMEEYFSRPSLVPLLPLSRILRAISATAAWPLSGTIGDALEHMLAQWQIRRVRRKIKKGGDASGLIFSEDAVTLYYPDIKNKAVMARYAAALEKIDF